MKLHFILIILISYCHTLSAQINPNPLVDVPKNFKYKNELLQLIYLPGGNFTSGNVQGHDSMPPPVQAKVTVNDFLLSRFEVSNGEYHRFVQYVLDSMAHSLLWQVAGKRIDWKQKIDWTSNLLEALMIDPDNRIYGKREIDPSKIMYRFANGETVAAYPDTLVWIKDFTYTYNEPIAKKYFSHPAFAGYPVTGISFRQAMAYCEWKQVEWNNALQASGSKIEIDVHLPTSVEWEYAAINNIAKDDSAANGFNLFDKTQTTGYPNPSHPDDKQLRNEGYQYNFGVIEDINGFRAKDYADDGSFYMAPCQSYRPGKKGFYNLHGNIAEWTSTQNTHYHIAKGGSWESIPYYLQPGANQYFKTDERHSYIGFRIAVSVKN